MTRIELIYDGDCPNIEPAREAVRKALSSAGLPLEWREWDRADAQAPTYVQGYGSPTVLVNGRDLAGQEPGASKSCRVYTDSDGHLTGVPPVELITAALRGGPTQGPETPVSAQHDCCDSTTQERPPLSRPQLSGRLGTWAMGGSVLSAVASSACCWLPLLLIGFGASAVGVAAFFEKFRGLSLGAAALLLAVGFYFNYFRKEECAPGSACESPSPKLRRFNQSMLWLATAFVLAFALFPNYVGALIGAPQAPAAQAATADPYTVELAVEGMTCGGCAANLEKALYGVPGVITADVSYQEEKAVIELDPSAATANASLLEAVKKAGFSATVSDTAAAQVPTTLHFSIEGMTCGGCEAHVLRALGNIPGVLRVEVSYKGKSAAVELDPGVGVEPDTLIQAIEKVGYRAVLEPAKDEGETP